MVYRSILLTFFGMFFCLNYGFSVQLKPGANVAQTADKFSVSIRKTGESAWVPVKLYSTRVNVRSRSDVGTCTFSNFDADFSKGIEIKVVKKGGPSSNVSIRPTRLEIPYSLKNNELVFKLYKPGKLSVEFDNDRLNNLLLFANNSDSNIPDPGDVNVRYLSKGTHEASAIKLKSGQTLYLEEGAIVKGALNVYNLSNITIRGRGIIDGSRLNHDRSKLRQNLLKFKNGSNIQIDGITLIDSPVWTVFIDDCSNVKITNVKVISHMINGDGITISQSKEVVVDGVFIRSADDNISLKSMQGKDCRNIKISNSVLWADDAHNMLVGPESRGAVLEDISFTNIDVLENTQAGATYSGMMAIMAGDNGIFKNIKWNNIFIDDVTKGEIIRVQYTKAHSKKGSEFYGRGVDSISFSNIFYNGTKASLGSVYGLDQKRVVKGVNIQNFVYKGNPIEINKVNISNKLSLKNDLSDGFGKLRTNSFAF